MNRNYFILLVLLGLSSSFCFGQLMKPQDFLNTDYGNQFTPHHQVVAYAKYVAENSDRVNLEVYGYTNQDRPLVKMTISTPQNLAEIEEIRKNHIELTDTNKQTDDHAIVWLSFGVHGNEAGASESSMTVMYELASGTNDKADQWLENTVVILDPSINPDGYDRYTHWVRNISTKEVQPETYAREHHEPWPGGRVNHYLFDLNRDWAWVTQVESQQRIAQYNEWLPHIHVDFHEMGHNSHYYFAPAARPYHQSITQFQSDFQVEIGKNNAKYFDSEGWLYFTRETFDLLYPSYGDTYPTFNGAIGMTYEQAGHSKAGRAIFLENRDTLTLQDRIDHHTTTALSTVEVASMNADRLNVEMAKFFQSNPEGQYKSYIIKRRKGENLDDLRKILDTHKIEYGQASKDLSSNGFNFMEGIKTNCQINKGDLVINADQKKSVLITTLFDPEPGLQDSVTYDITAWSLPMAFGLEAFAFDNEMKKEAFTKYAVSISKDINCTAYAIPYNFQNAPQAVANVINSGIHCRFTEKDIQQDGITIEKGAIIITQADNRKNENWRDTFLAICKKHQINFHALKTGFAMSGPDLGSRSVNLIKQQKVGALSGEGLNGNSFGQLWYYFEQVLDYPLVILDKKDLSYSALNDLDALILEEGWYQLNENEKSLIEDWISKGGKMITIGSASMKFVDEEGYKLKSKEEKKSTKDKEAKPSNYQAEERDYIARSIPGSVIKAKLDPSHPLCFGLGKYYYTLRTSSRVIPMQTEVRNAIYVDENYQSYGFIGSKVKKKNEKTLVAGVERHGAGTIVYLPDNPLYRGFWKAGNRLVFNALFLVSN